MCCCACCRAASLLCISDFSARICCCCAASAFFSSCTSSAVTAPVVVVFFFAGAVCASELAAISRTTHHLRTHFIFSPLPRDGGHPASQGFNFGGNYTTNPTNCDVTVSLSTGYYRTCLIS